jgi:RNA polymerase sigma factor (sigma-70 family)
VELARPERADRADLPLPLARLLSAEGSDSEDRAWHEFVDAYSRLLIRVAQSMGPEYDAAMDRYTFLLERLRRDHYARLRRYAARSGVEFSHWLSVVARRLCLDFHRHQYGRVRGYGRPGDAHRAQETRRVRRRLLALGGGAPGELEEVCSRRTDEPDATLERREMLRALHGAVAHLDYADQALLRLRFEENLPAAKIAALLELPSQFHVYRRLKQLLQALHAELAAQGVEPLDG